MPTKRIFDLVLLTVVLSHSAVGLVRLEARRLARENGGPAGSLGRALAVGL